MPVGSFASGISRFERDPWTPADPPAKARRGSDSPIFPYNTPA